MAGGVTFPVAVPDAEAIQAIADMADLIEEGAGHPDISAQLREDSAADAEPLGLTDEGGEDEREVMEFEDDLQQVCFADGDPFPLLGLETADMLFSAGGTDG